MSPAKRAKTTKVKAAPAAAPSQVSEAPDAAFDAAEAAPKKARAKRAKPTGRSLVIVESPAKARTIGRFLGKDFEVRASMGHVRDLKKSGLSVEIDAKGVRPVYVTIPDKVKVVAELQKLANDAPTVYFATDLDREGEAIAWHLVEALGVPPERRSRVTFHEITKRAIDDAFLHPGTLNEPRVDAQQARRILDRIVGYPLSQLLSKSISRGLSAGRVQSVAVKLIVDREKEIRAHNALDYWRVFADLSKQGAGEAGQFTADLVHVDQVSDDDSWAADAATPEGTEDDLEAAGEAAPEEGADAPAAKGAPKKSRELRMHKKEDADALVAEVRGAAFVVESVEGKRRAEWAPPPYITSTLQQQGSIRLRWPTKRVMKVAQELYEGLAIGEEGPTGLITYMRTDSVSLAPEAIGAARSYIAERFGADHVPEKANFFRSKQGAQEAHEAIRPTDVRRTPQAVKRYLSDEQYSLYRLVWERFVACQMAPSQIDTTTVRVRAGRAVFEARGRVIVFAGWRAVSAAPKKDDDDPQLPIVAERERLDLRELRNEMRTTQPPPRYSEATLVKRLEKEGIGRPSTYADIIGKIQNRNYVLKQANKFHATRLGEVVTDRMTPWFPELMDIGFTRSMEEDLDKVEAGQADWQDLIRRFQKDFVKDLAIADIEMVKEKFKPAEGQKPCDTCGKPMVERFSMGRVFYGCSGYPECAFTRGSDGDRKVAIATEHVCEKCTKPMVIREGKRGRFLACSGYPECKNAKDLREDGTVVEPVVTGVKCEKCGAEMVVKRGRRGPFLACSGYPACQNARDLNAPAPAAADPAAILTGGDATAAAAPGALVPLPPCPKCGAPTAIRRSFRGGFCGCTKYPECKGTAPVPAGALPKREPPKPAGVNCPDCSKPMIIRQGRRGPFAGCSGYPKCRGTMPMEDVIAAGGGGGGGGGGDPAPA
ncbi:MAG: type I DNA topoisomerase [Planctomycetes bacterium]|nr:type I DNA topoisomerase [Planctomycetota bacterium]